MFARIHRTQTLPTTGPAIAVEFMDGMGEMQPHGHDYIEMVAVVSGSARHSTEHVSRMVSRGYCAVIRPGEWHGWTRCEDLRLWNIYVGPEVFWRELRWFRDSTAGSRLVGLPHPRQLIERSLTENEVAQVDSWLSLMPPREANGIAMYARRVAALGGALGEIAAGRGPHDDDLAEIGHWEPVVAAAVYALEQDLARPWTVADLAELTHLSSSHLSRVFSQSTGMSPMTYLARMRAERVAADLLNSNTLISEIGRRHGWPDPNYLARRFRQFFGISPRGFRSRYGHPGG